MLKFALTKSGPVHEKKVEPYFPRLNQNDSANTLISDLQGNQELLPKNEK